MKRIFSVIAAIAIAGLAALCVYCVAAGVASDANKAASIYAPDSNTVEMMEEQESVKFSSLQAYIDYMTGGNGAASANSIQQSSGYYYVPANLPEDITVTSVEIVEDGTVFTYNVAREVLIDVALTDSDMRELFSTMQTKVYNTVSGKPYDFITDTAAYAENLAKSLNAQRVSSSAPISSLYYGAANVRWQAFGLDRGYGHDSNILRVLSSFRLSGRSSCNKQLYPLPHWFKHKRYRIRKE